MPKKPYGFLELFPLSLWCFMDPYGFTWPKWGGALPGHPAVADPFHLSAGLRGVAWRIQDPDETSYDRRLKRLKAVWEKGGFDYIYDS